MLNKINKLIDLMLIVNLAIIISIIIFGITGNKDKEKEENKCQCQCQY